MTTKTPLLSVSKPAPTEWGRPAAPCFGTVFYPISKSFVGACPFWCRPSPGLAPPLVRSRLRSPKLFTIPSPANFSLTFPHFSTESVYALDNPCVPPPPFPAPPFLAPPVSRPPLPRFLLTRSPPVRCGPPGPLPPVSSLFPCPGPRSGAASFAPVPPLFASWRLLGASWSLLDPPRPSWSHLAPPRASCDLLGPPGRLRGPLGGLLGASWSLLAASWRLLAASLHLLILPGASKDPLPRPRVVSGPVSDPFLIKT